MSGGDLEMVKVFIAEAVKRTHVELTTLIVPGENDTPEEMRRMNACFARLYREKWIFSRNNRIARGFLSIFFLADRDFSME